MLKKKISWVLAMTMAATMLGGCLTTSAEESSYDGTIRWLNYKPEVADAMQEIAAAYTEETESMFRSRQQLPDSMKLR